MKGYAVTLLAGLAAASPLKTAVTRRSHPMIPYTGDKAQAASGNSTYASESSNWSGAAITSPPSGTHFTSVTGTFTVPKPSPPESGSGSWYGSSWVGIDGDTVSSALFQGGIQWEVTRSSSGALSYDYGAWIEWIPNASDPINFSLSAGDSITVTCTASSSTEGSCKYVNNTTGKSTTASTSAPSSSAALKGDNVEWIVEDFELGNGLAPFANYGSETFTGCSATTASGSTVGTGNAGAIDLVDDNGNVISSCSISSSSSIKCTYE